MFPSPLGKLIREDLTLVFWFFWAGKTFYTVEQAYNAYKDWDIVISNMWLAFPHIRWYTADELPPIIQEIQNYHDNVATPIYAPNSYKWANWVVPQKGKTRRFFILIDEAAIFFNARNFKQNFNSPEMIEFFVQPRKFDCSIAVICQSLKMIDVNFVRLAQEVVEFRKWIWWLFRLWEWYDTKYLNIEDWGWDPNTPVTRRKFFLHPFFTLKAKIQFIWGLYYTKEILWERAIRRPEHIKTLQEYFTKEKEDKEFHNWHWKILKSQVFWLTKEQEKEDTENAIKNDKE